MWNLGTSPGLRSLFKLPLLHALWPLPACCLAKSRSRNRIDKKEGKMALIAKRLRSKVGGGNIFAAATAMADQYKSVNLGQGFPSFPTPSFLTENANIAMKENHNQYSRPAGHPLLMETLAKHYKNEFASTIDPMKNITSMVGAQEGIFNVVVAFCDEGDHMLCIEPYFDAYKKAGEVLGVNVTGVPLRFQDSHTDQGLSARDYTLDLNELSDSITEKTKVLVLNTPHNPTGKVFSQRELQGIADIVSRHPQIVILSDEVYEYMTFDGLPHVRFANLPGMWDRTISLYSAGKTFSCTGWRVGYCIGPEHLIQPLMDTIGIISFCAPTPLQVAISSAFEQAKEPNWPGGKNYFQFLSSDLASRRDKLCKQLSQSGLKPIVPEGGYFVMANTGGIPLEKNDEPRDVVVNRWLTETIKVTGIPTSYFYSSSNVHLSDDWIRFAYCKDDRTLQAAIDNLAAFQN